MKLTIHFPSFFLRLIPLFILFCLRTGLGNAQQPGSLDLGFNVSGSGVNGTINAVAVQPDGKIMIVGSFTSYSGTTCKNIVRLNQDGTIDPSFSSQGSGVNGIINDVEVLANGKILIVGGFTSYNGLPFKYVGRLMPNGDYDATFYPGTGVNGAILEMAIQPDGKIVLVGEFTTYNGSVLLRIMRILPDGLPDNFSNQPQPNAPIKTIAMQPDGKFIIGGQYIFLFGVNRNRIARLNSSGSFDSSFNLGTGANNDVEKVVVQPDGKVLVAGKFTEVNGVPRGRIARLLSNGNVDTSFNPGSGADNDVKTISLQADGKIIVGGEFTSFDGTPAGRIIRLNSDGSRDTSFNSGQGANAIVNAIAIQTDGKLVVGGAFTEFASTAVGRLVRIIGGPYATITTGTLSSSICPGSSINIPFIVNGPIGSNNMFAAQLSNAYGSFLNPLVIGTLVSSSSGSINALIPANTMAGLGYRIRVVATSPFSTSDNGGDLNILAPPTIIVSSNPSSICIGNSAFITATGASAYSWSGGQTTSIISVSPASTSVYTVNGTSAQGCTANAIFTLPVHSFPTASFTYQQTGCCTIIITNTSSGGQSYSYDFGDSTPIATGPNPIHTYASPGTYNIEQTVNGPGGCVSTYTQTISIISSTPNELETKVGLYPNPTTGQLWVDLTNLSADRDVEVRVMNFLGQQVNNYSLRGGCSHSINLPSINAGSYIIGLFYHEEQLLKQIVLQE